MNTDRLHILIVGCGGREHSIAKALHKSRLNPRLFCFGTYKNPGILALVNAYGTSDNITNQKEIVSFACDMSIDFAIIGPEAPLKAGVADALFEKGIKCIGPYKDLARLETSKHYTRKLLSKYGLYSCNPKWKAWNCPEKKGFISPEKLNTPSNRITNEAQFKQLQSQHFNHIEPEIRSFVDNLEGQFVIKCDGLKGGKGVYVKNDHFSTTQTGIDICRDLYNERESFVIEEKLQGQEFSLMTFCDGKNFVHCPIVRDYKRANNGNSGSNTGGMGTVSCSNHRLPFLTEDDVKRARQITEHTIRGLSNDNNDTYIGIVYGGFMKLNDTGEIKVIEYNARLGDPEGINVLHLLEYDFGDLCLDMLNQNLSQERVNFKNLDTKCIYIVPKGYPNNKRDNFVVPKQFLEKVIPSECGDVDLMVSGINHSKDIYDAVTNDSHTGNVYIEEVQTIGDTGELTYKTVHCERLKVPDTDNVLTLDEMTPEDSVSSESTNNVELEEVVVHGMSEPEQVRQEQQVQQVQRVPQSKNDMRASESNLITTGSRCIALIGVGKRGIRNLEKIMRNLRHNEEIVDRFAFRHDIGNGILQQTIHSGQQNRGLYAASGVDIDTGNEAVQSIQHFVKNTHTPNVIENDGGFGGMIRVPGTNDLVMINSTDSVGSKVIFVRQWWRKTKAMRSLGMDIVNHCVNDILVQSPSVQPSTFMDYYATDKLDPVDLRWFVQGVSEACQKVNCVLIGGETAEIPGTYRTNGHDLVGAITGFVELSKVLQPKKTIQVGDIVLGIPSDSPHTNGFSLIRDLVTKSKESGDTSYLRYVDDWCKPHRCYMNDIRALSNVLDIKGLCHITGGGFIDNPKRILPDGMHIDFDWYAIDDSAPDWMNWLRNKMREIDPDFDEREVRRTFNCGIGMLVVINHPDNLDSLIRNTNIEGLRVVGVVANKKT